MSLNIEQLESLGALEGIEPEWRELWERDTAASPFENPGWLLPWTRHMWAGGRLRVLAVRHSGDLVGLAPLFHWGYGGKPEIIRVSLLGSGISDQLGIIAAPAFSRDAARTVLEHLVTACDEWHLCDLRELRHNSPLLRAEIPAGLSGRDAPYGACAVLGLPPSMAGLLGAVDAGFRRNLHVAQTRLARDGPIEFVRATRHTDMVPLIDELFRFEGYRRLDRGNSGIMHQESLRRFHLEMAERLAAQDMMRLYALRCAGRTIAVQVHLRRRERHFYYLSASDPAYARSNPEAILLAGAIQQAIEEGAREMDFLRGREDLKYQWGARDRTSRKLLIARSFGYVRSVA